MARRVTTSMIFVSLVTLIWQFAQLSQAAMMYPDQMGDTVWFRNIVEDSTTDAADLPLFGPPSVVGDGLDFPTTGSFSANSTSGSGPDITDGKLTLMIEAKPGFFLDKLSIGETLVGVLDAPFGGDARATVAAFALVDVVEINGQPVAGPQLNDFLNFVPDDEFQVSLGDSGPFVTEGDTMIPLPPGTTKVNVAINNILTAATIDPGTLALIDKKNFDIDVETVVPEPTTLLLSVVGIASVLTVRRSQTSRMMSS